MWELRVFGEPGKVRVPEPLRSASRDEEERTDVYFLFADTAPVSTPSRRVDGTLGLKLRSNAIGSKCELKRRYARDPNAVELWEKVFEHRLPLDAWWLSALLEHLGGRGKDALPPVTSPQDLARACETWGLGTPRVVSVRKRIAKAPRPPASFLEHSEIEIESPDRKTRLVRHTLAVEAPTLETCLSVGRASGLQPAAEAPTGIIVAGYPEALAVLASRAGAS